MWMEAKNMNNHQIKLFLEVEDSKSFSLVAKKHLTDYQNISYHINCLEKEFNVKLFNRNKTGCTLTPAGEEFKLFAEDYLVSYQKVKNKMNNINSMIILGVDISLVNPISSQVASTNSFNNFSIYPANYENLLGHLKNGDISCYFGHEKNWDKRIHFEPIYQDQLCVVTSKKNKLYKCNELSFSDLSGLAIDLSINKCLLSEIPVDELSKNNTVYTDSPRSAYDHHVFSGQSITISSLLYKGLCPPSICFIPLKDSFVDYGLFYLYKTKPIEELIEAYKLTASYFTKPNNI